MLRPCYSPSDPFHLRHCTLPVASVWKKAKNAPCHLEHLQRAVALWRVANLHGLIWSRSMSITFLVWAGLRLNIGLGRFFLILCSLDFPPAPGC